MRLPQMVTPLNSSDSVLSKRTARVVVAMSGGVDSSVVAAMLADEGYDVVGITLQLYDHGAALARKGACCAGRDIHDARRVAEAIGFPHYVLDYESRFRASVIDEFADAYLAGATPVPCIRCNERVKFRDLLETARDLEADCMATGHYVRRVDGPGRAGAAPRGRPGARPELLPVRHHPRRSSTSCASRSASSVQGGDAGAGRALRPAGRRQAGQPGHLLRAERLLCRGDRAAAPGRGRARRDRAPRRPGARAPRGGHPLSPSASAAGSASAAASRSSCVRLDPAARQVVVGPRAALASRSVRVAEVNWLGDADFDAAPAEGWEAAVRIRSTRPPVPARIHPTGPARARSSCWRPRRASRRARPASSTRPRAAASSAAAGSCGTDRRGAVLAAGRRERRVGVARVAALRPRRAAASRGFRRRKEGKGRSAPRR